ncbi:MAG: hypothetical protein RMK19_09170, partial [Bacteroidia bacterium]|nr:hypothetical protein [Bacteroidia bacterium]
MGEKYNAFAFWAAYPAWLSYDANFGEMEQIVSNLLSKVEVRKSWTPDLLGHFGGGLVDFQLPTSGGDQFQVSLTSEVDAGVVGKQFAYFRSPLRFPLSSDFPSTQEVQVSENHGRPLPENFEYGRKLRRYTVPDTIKWGTPGMLATLSFGRQREKWHIAFRSAFSQRYLSSTLPFVLGYFTPQSDGQWRFEEYLRSTVPDLIFQYARGGGTSWSMGYKLSKSLSAYLEGIAFLNTLIRTSRQFASYINPEISTTEKIDIFYPTFHIHRSYLVLLRPTVAYHNQRGYQFKLQAGAFIQAHDIPQNGAMNYAEYPGTTEYSYEHQLYGPSEIFAQVWTSRARASQYYLHPYMEKKWGSAHKWLQLRIGGWYSAENQKFSGRQLGFMTDTLNGGPNVLDASVYHLSNIRDVYAPANIRPGGWYLIERTGDFHRHTANTDIVAGYGWLRAGISSQVEMMIGSRYEMWSRKIYYQPIVSDKDALLMQQRTAHLLPAFLIKYHFGDRHILRSGANITLLRPPVASQVPLPYFDYYWVIYWQGNPQISTGMGYNIDLKYEWLRSKDNVFSFCLFYKSLQKIPEIYLVPESYALVYVYSTRQRRWGEIVGLEMEFRQLWWSNEKSQLWSYTTVTLSESGVEQAAWSKIGRLDGRLQGHAPVVANAGIFFTRPRWEVGCFFNYTSTQIWAVGFDPYIFPHVLEERRLTAEAQVSYRIARHWEIRLAIWDIINQPYRRTQRLANADSFKLG